MHISQWFCHRERTREFEQNSQNFTLCCWPTSQSNFSGLPQETKVQDTGNIYVFLKVSPSGVSWICFQANVIRTVGSICPGLLVWTACSHWRYTMRILPPSPEDSRQTAMTQDYWKIIGHVNSDFTEVTLKKNPLAHKIKGCSCVLLHTHHFEILAKPSNTDWLFFPPI